MDDLNAFKYTEIIIFMENVTHQYLFICTKCREIIFDISDRAHCPTCDKEMPCLGYIPQCKIDEVREAIKLWWRDLL